MLEKILLNKNCEYEAIKVQKSTKNPLIIGQEDCQKIEQMWQHDYKAGIKAGRKVWNGQNVRLDLVVFEDEKVELFVSPVEYKIVYCLGNIDVGKDENNLPRALSTGNLIQTVSGKFVFAKLSGNTMYQREFDVIVGLVDKIDIQNGIDLWQESLREIKEEIGLDDNFIDQKHFLGIIQTYKGNAIFVNYVKLNIGEEEVQQIFIQNNDKELKGVYFVDEKNLKEALSKLKGRVIFWDLYQEFRKQNSGDLG